ncbi:MAG: O-antigen ligase family protein [Elusimicrobiota bacterium]
MKPRIPSAVLEGLLYALTAFGVFAFGGVEPWSRAAIEVLALLLALACFLKGRPAGSLAGSTFWLFPAAVAGLGGLQLATVTGPDCPYPLRPFTVVPYETRAAVLLWISYAAVAWSVPRVIVTHHHARRYARALFSIGLLLACLGLLQKATGGHFHWMREELSFGSYYNRDHAANILLMSLSVGSGLFFTQPGWLMAGAILLIVLGLFACSSQAAFLAIPLAACVVSFLAADFERDALPRRLRAIASLAFGALMVFFTYHHVVSNADAGALIDRHVMGRLSIYGDAWRWWRDSPLFGTGLGSFETVYSSYQDLALLGTASHAHSDWIEFTLETGLLGLLGASLAVVVAAYCFAQTWRRARSREMRAMMGGALGAVAAFAAQSLFEFSFQIPANAIVLFGLLGLLLSAPSWADKTVVPVPSRAPSLGAALLAAGYCLALMRSAVVPAVAAWRASRPGEPLERIVSLARGAALDENPVLWARLSAASYMASGDGEKTDFVLLRLSLRYAMAALERRPFNSDVLYLSGRTLERLRRFEDAENLLARASMVRFAPFEPRRQTAAQRWVIEKRRVEKNLGTLRELNLLPGKPETP